MPKQGHDSDPPSGKSRLKSYLKHSLLFCFVLITNKFYLSMLVMKE